MACDRGMLPEDGETAPEQAEWNENGIAGTKHQTLARDTAPQHLFRVTQLPLQGLCDHHGAHRPFIFKPVKSTYYAIIHETTLN